MPFVPSGIPAGLGNIIQNNMLSRIIFDTLMSQAKYRADATRIPLPPGTGQTALFNRLGAMGVDLRPAQATGATSRGQFAVEQFTAAPQPYAQSFDVDAPTAYAEIGDYNTQGITRLAEWAGRTMSRKARQRLFAAAGGYTIIRRAQSSGQSILLVDSLAGFRFKSVNGVQTAVSSTNKIPLTIVAASTITTCSVTGVLPIDPDFPDGPGELQLDSTFGAAVAAQSYVYATNQAPFIIRSNSATPGVSRASTEALIATDIPTLNDIMRMRSKLKDQGIMPHPSTGTYHLHVDSIFFEKITQDTAYRQAFQTQGLSPIFGAGSAFSPALGLTIIENNDSPANGKGDTVAVGGTGGSVNTSYVGTGGAGTPGSSLQLRENGLPVVNSSGVVIRRSVMTGAGVLIESAVDEMQYIQMVGGQKIHDFSSNLAAYQLGGTQIVAGNVDGWRLLIRPPIDERMLTATITVSNTFDFILPTDTTASSDLSDARPYKRAVVLEHGSSY